MNTSNASEPNPATLVRDLRQILGITQEKLAQRLRVSFPTVNRWENGRSKPSPLALKQIEDLLIGLGDEGKSLLRQHFRGERE